MLLGLCIENLAEENAFEEFVLYAQNYRAGITRLKELWAAPRVTEFLTAESPLFYLVLEPAFSLLPPYYPFSLFSLPPLLLPISLFSYPSHSPLPLTTPLFHARTSISLTRNNTLLFS